ncbi:hypothetical protein [Frigoriglobus tundricola]|uniref:Uncharacterized protein n=1 Tax=Frigoriglobus tundricola TaxID=2774151 RepID=A0A6M5YXC0_9BACT|nr:hypothetical protein [Frigoriglobus tundricola]QJW97853.1 hypothetical protein FTUN_5433 [Frigoriglobus tundricola]
MSLAVVRCPECRGESRVTTEALGHMVGCPRCQSPFVAEEEIPVVQPVTRSAPPRPVTPVTPRRARPDPQPDLPRSAPTASPAEAPVEIPDPEHDPHLPPVAGLPVSVLVGLALLPFGIPLLWRVAPFLTGRDAQLSLAVPVALAAAAAALCLGVVYTIDWTASTRIKGVLMLVGLAYLTAAGLFYLKKDMMDRVRALGGDPNEWNYVSLNDGKCGVLMPGRAEPDRLFQPLAGLVQMTEVRRARTATDDPEVPGYVYYVAVSRANPDPIKPDNAWFARVGAKLKNAGGKLLGDDGGAEVKHQDVPGRQWEFELDGGQTRIVRVFVIKGRVYYLSAEGPRLTPDHEDYGAPFFEKFYVTIN